MAVANSVGRKHKKIDELSFVFFAIDNIDFAEDTESTTHGTITAG